MMMLMMVIMINMSCYWTLESHQNHDYDDDHDGDDHDDDQYENAVGRSDPGKSSKS